MRNDYSLRFTVKASYSKNQLRLARFELLLSVKLLNPQVGRASSESELTTKLGEGPAVPISGNECLILDYKSNQLVFGYS